MYSDFVSLPVGFLNSWVVGVFVRNEVCRFDVATVGVFTFSVEDLFVQFDVVVVDSIIESDGDHLGDISGGQVSRDDGAIFGAEAVGQHTLWCVARWSPVRVVVDVYDKQNTVFLYLIYNLTKFIMQAMQLTFDNFLQCRKFCNM